MQRRLREALTALANYPSARWQLQRANDPDGVEAIDLVGISTVDGLLTLHLVVVGSPS